MGKLKVLTIAILYLTFLSCDKKNKKTLVEEENKFEQNNTNTDELRKVVELDSLNGLKYIYFEDNFRRKQGLFVGLTYEKDTVQTGFFKDNILLGYMSFFEKGHLFEKRSFQYGIDNSPIPRDIIKLKGGEVDSLNSCFLNWDLKDGFTLPWFKDSLNLKGKLFCNMVYDNFQIIKWSKNQIDTSYTNDNNFEISFTQNNIIDNFVRFQVNYFLEFDSSYTIKEWYLPVDRQVPHTSQYSQTARSMPTQQ